MAEIIVEDGNVVAGANSYVSVADFKTYCTDRGYVITAFQDAQIVSALLFSCEYLNAQNFLGFPATLRREMAFPRLEIDEDGIIPSQLVKSQCYLAYKVLQNYELFPTLERGGAIQSQSVGSLSTSYFESADATDDITYVKNILKDYLKSKNIFKARV